MEKINMHYKRKPQSSVVFLKLLEKIAIKQEQ